MYGWMGGWMGVLMGRVMDDEMWARGWCGGWGYYSILLTGAATYSLEKDAHGG